MNIRSCRKRISLLVAMYERGLNVRQLAEESRVNPAHLSRIVCNRVDNPKSETKRKLAAALGAPVEQLFPEGAQ